MNPPMVETGRGASLACSHYRKTVVKGDQVELRVYPWRKVIPIAPGAGIRAGP